MEELTRLKELVGEVEKVLKAIDWRESNEMGAIEEGQRQLDKSKAEVLALKAECDQRTAALAEKEKALEVQTSVFPSIEAQGSIVASTPTEELPPAA